MDIGNEKAALSAILGISVGTVAEHPFEDVDSITGRVSLGKPSIRKYDIEAEDGTCRTVVCKHLSGRIIRNGIRLLNYRNSPRILLELLLHHRILGFDGSHLREARFYENLPSALRHRTVEFYGAHRDERTERCMLVMKDHAGHPPASMDDYLRVLDAVTDFHAYFYNAPMVIDRLGLNEVNVRMYRRCHRLPRLLFGSLSRENRVLYTPENLALLRAFARRLPAAAAALPIHNTLCHNDLSSRNVLCDGEAVMLYDWELGAYRNPEHDLVDFLASVAHTLTDGEVRRLVSAFRTALAEKTGVALPDETFAALLRFNLLEFTLIRATILRIANRRLRQDFIDRMAANTDRLISLMQKGLL